MKHNWEYKRLGELCDIKRGGSPRPIQQYITDSPDGINWIKIGDAGESKYITSCKEKIIPEGVSKSRFVHKGDFLLSNSMSFGRPYILDVDGCIHDGWLVLEKPKQFITDFLYYVLGSPAIYSEFSRLARGAVVSNLNVDLVSRVKVPVPTIIEQERIVAELDEINELIAIRKEQLQELDNLAQSLFYDTFGDPISNPKDWEVKKLGEYCEVSSAKRVLVEDVVDKGIPFIRGTELAVLSKQPSYDDSVFTMFITPEHYERVKAITGVPVVGDLLIPSINADGYVWEVNTHKPFYFKDGRVLWVHVNNDIYSSKWLRYALSKIIKAKYANLSRGAVFAELTLIFLRSLPIIVPPVEKQRNFEEIISKIEKQKTILNESLKELQILLDSRMDYWFN